MFCREEYVCIRVTAVEKFTAAHFSSMSIDVHCNYVGLSVVKQPMLLCRTNEHHIYVAPYGMYTNNRAVHDIAVVLIPKMWIFCKCRRFSMNVSNVIF